MNDRNAPPAAAQKGADPGLEPVDDCWNRIGIRGDRSCPRLAEHVHCHNCPVHAAAAALLLDRYRAGDEPPARPPEPAGGEAVRRQAILVFRVGGEWLGLSPKRVLEVLPPVRIHGLPHQRGGNILGVANIRGILAGCVSLGSFLEVAAAGESGAGRRAAPMVLVLDAPGGPLAAPVDEVGGIHAAPADGLLPARGEADQPVARFARSILHWRGRAVTVLDDTALLQALVGSLA